MIRVCPKRDAVCPHGMDCPFVIDRYDCKPEPPVQRSAEPADAALEAVISEAASEANMTPDLTSLLERIEGGRGLALLSAMVRGVMGSSVAESAGAGPDGPGASDRPCQSEGGR